ncbi:glycosyltransferase family 2 protein [candidate division WOR-3 bacterium]|nr:glycosyltransferase family 2 protein [candidate division WOR-3 bacterium]
MKVSVVIPVYDEEATIENVIDGVKNALTDWDYEVIIVDDFSCDSTYEILKNKNEIKLIRHIENKGVGMARKRGILEATGDVIVMLDGDGTYPAEEIPHLLQFIPEYDMVVGARKIESGTRKILRTLAKKFIKKIAEYITGKKIPDLNSGMRVFKKSVAVRFLGLLPDGHSWVSTQTIAFLSDKYDVKYVPIDYYKREGGKSSFHPIADTLSFFLLVFRTVLYFNPLKVFLPIASLIIVGGVIRTIYNARILHRIKESDIIILMIGMFAFIIGFIADLIVKTHKKDYYR